MRIDPYDQYAAYLQDSWRINKYLSLNIGLRYNYIDAYTPPQAEQTMKLPITSWHTFEPRIALGIDPFGDGKTGVKVSWSKYATMMWTWFYGLNPNGQDMTQYLVLGPGEFYPIYQSQAYLFEVDENLKRPYVQEIFFSIDRTIGKDFVIKLSFVDRKFKNFITISDNNYDPDFYIPYEITNLVTGEPMTIHYRAEGAPDPFDYYTNDPRAKRHYRALIIELTKRISHNFMFRLNYTLSRMTGTTAQDSAMYGSGYWNYPDVLLYGEGVLSGDRTHVIKFSGIWFLPYGFVLSSNYSGSSGYPYARTFQVPLPPYNSPSTFPGEEPGSFRSPFVHYLDVRLSKDINFGSRKLSLFVESYNLLNLNQTTSIWSQVNHAVYDYGQIMGIQSARIFQLGARFVF
jgi:outer membrane receptor protein involved in Fe transport